MKLCIILRFLVRFNIILVIIPYYHVFANQLVFQTVGVPSNSTFVGGIISENTTWTVANSPYIITETIQIPQNVRLIIEPQVQVKATSGVGWMFYNFGEIIAHGKERMEIEFVGTGEQYLFSSYNGKGYISLAHCIIRDMYRGLYSFGYDIGTFRLTDSIITFPCLIWLRPKEYPSIIVIERNTFLDEINFDATAGPAIIKNNLFLKGFTIYTRTPYLKVDCKTNYNSIYFPIVESNQIKYFNGLNVTYNYWGTNDANIIDTIIEDRKDSILYEGELEYLPILTKPHPDTPKIYYLEVRCVDREYESLVGLTVNLQNSQGYLFQVKTTNSTGWVKFTGLLPSDYALKAYWMGIKVLDENLTLIGEEQRTIQCSVQDLIIHVTNEKGDKLPNVLVTLFWLSGTKVSSMLTNSTGYSMFEKLPSATYNVKAALEGYREKSAEISLSSEDQIVTMTMQSIPFIETPLGIAAIFGVTIVVIAVTVVVILKKIRLKMP